MSVASSRSLSHTEARERAALLKVTSYDVVLDLGSGLDDPTPTFTSSTTVRFESRGGTTFLDLRPTLLRSAHLDGVALDPASLERGRLPLETGPGGHELVLDAVMPYRNDGEGLHLHRDPADGESYVYQMSFLDAAPTVFGCFDQPDLKAPYTFHVRAPRAWTVLGNAPAANPEPGIWEWGPTPPISTYVVTLVAGPWHVLRDSHDGIPLGLSCRQSLAPHLDKDAEELFTLTGQSFDELHRLFGIRYPFGDYHQAFVPEFNAGAMENPGCVTFRDQLVFDTRVTRGARLTRASTIAHEMAHQWFGDLVTPTWWDDLWLNESFAEYLGNRVIAEATQYADIWTHHAWARRQWGLLADSRPSTHPVAGNGAVDAVAALQDFDGISYAKGSSILKQLATSLGDEVFFAGVADHIEAHRFGNATMHDLFAAWQRAGADDLAPVVEEWLRKPGPDRFDHDRAAGLLRRTPPDRHPADRAHRFTVARLDDATVDTAALAVSSPTTALPAPLGTAGGGALVLDLDESSWGVYVPDRTTVRALVAELPRLGERSGDPVLQVAAWNNVKSGYAVGAVDPDDVVDLLAAALPVDDTEDTKRRTLPWALHEVIPAASPGALGRLHAAALTALVEAAPASERQLSAFRAAVSSAEDDAPLRRWLAEAPPGIEVDDDLRWRLLTRLAGLGATDRAELDAELAGRATSRTRVEHTRAVASLPTRAAKEFAWQRFTGEVPVSNYELSAAAAGLWTGSEGSRAALTAAYVERYVADLPGTAAVRSGWVLAHAAEEFFPAGHVDEDTLAATATLLEPGVLEPAVARSVGDQVDDLRRALAVRAAFPKCPAPHRAQDGPDA